MRYGGHMSDGYIASLRETKRIESIGTKARNLRFLEERGIPVPVTYVCNWDAHAHYVSDDLHIIDSTVIVPPTSRAPDQQNMPHGFRLHPNPAKEMVQLILDDPPGDDTWIRVYDLNGRKHFERKVSQQFVTLDLYGMETGLFLVELSSTVKRSTKLLLVE